MNAFKGIQFLGDHNFANCTTSGGLPGYFDVPSNTCLPVVLAVGATLYNVNVRNNTPFDVDLDGVSNDPTIGNYYATPYNGFFNGSCIIVDVGGQGYIGPVAGINASGQEISLPPYGIGAYNNTLTNPVPSNAAGGYGTLTTNGGTCPNPGWPAQTPAPSHNPSWHW